MQVPVIHQRRQKRDGVCLIYEFPPDRPEADAISVGNVSVAEHHARECDSSPLNVTDHPSTPAVTV
jgi:hypothetical protein